MRENIEKLIIKLPEEGRNRSVRFTKGMWKEDQV